jgi:hypothetical protein
MTVELDRPQATETTLAEAATNSRAQCVGFDKMGILLWPKNTKFAAPHFRLAFIFQSTSSVYR